MPKFLFVYHGGKMPETEDAQQKAMAAWGSWMEGLGAALVDGGAPVGMSVTVGSDGIANNGGANPASGYSMVEAADQAAAAELARGCPIIADGGSVEVAEIMQM